MQLRSVYAFDREWSANEFAVCTASGGWQDSRRGGQELDETQITAYVLLVVFTVMTYVCSEYSNRGRQDAKSKISTEVWGRGQA